MANEPLDDEDLDLGVEKEGVPWKKVIIIGAAVLLLLGVGGGVAWFFLAPGDDAAPASEEQAEAAAVEEQKGPAIYHALNPVFVVNLPPGGRAKMLQVGVEVRVRSPELVEFLKHNDPMVRHNLLTIFSTRKSEVLRDRVGKEKLQADVLGALQGIIEEQGGPGEVEAVYFTSFVMQ